MWYMIVVRGETRASRAAVWAVMSELDRWDELIPTVSGIDRRSAPGPIGVGTRYRVRQPGLPAAEYTVTDWSPDAGFTWEARAGGVRTVADHRLRPHGEGTRIELGIEWSGPAAPLVKALLARKARAYMRRELAALKALAEDGPPPR